MLLGLGLVVCVGEAQRFLVDELLEGLLGQVVELHGDAEGLFGHGLRGKKDRKEIEICASKKVRGNFHLVSGIVVLFQVGMRQGLLDRYPLVRVEREHFAEQVERLLVGLREELVPRNLRLERQRLQVAARLLVHYAVQVFLRRRAQNTQDVVQLIQVVLAREDRPIAEHLSQDASDRPDVDGFCVALGVEHDFRCAVPSSGDVFR